MCLYNTIEKGFKVEEAGLTVVQSKGIELYYDNFGFAKGQYILKNQL